MTRGRETRVIGVVPTFHRNAELTLVVQSAIDQTHPMELLFVVDNADEAAVRDLVRGLQRDAGSGTQIEYIPSPANVGPAGATALAMRRALAIDASGWFARLDDDRPLSDSHLVQELVDVGDALLDQDKLTSAVGLVGSRMNWKTGRLQKPPNSPDLVTQVDFLATNFVPLFWLPAVRDVGVFRDDLFFGWTEIEYGLRLRRHGYHLYRYDGRSDGRMPSEPSLALRDPGWRDFYSIRNQVHLMRIYGSDRLALKMAIQRAVAKPLLSAPRSPVRAARAARMGTRAAWDGWRGHMGRTVDPADELDDAGNLTPT